MAKYYIIYFKEPDRHFSLKLYQLLLFKPHFHILAGGGGGGGAGKWGHNSGRISSR